MYLWYSPIYCCTLYWTVLHKILHNNFRMHCSFTFANSCNILECIECKIFHAKNRSITDTSGHCVGDLIYEKLANNFIILSHTFNALHSIIYIYIYISRYRGVISIYLIYWIWYWYNIFDELKIAFIIHNYTAAWCSIQFFDAVSHSRWASFCCSIETIKKPLKCT